MWGGGLGMTFRLWAGSLRLPIAFDFSAIAYADLKVALFEVFAGESCLQIAEG